MEKSKTPLEWKTKIPMVRLPDGTLAYDCDIFGGDNVDLSQFDNLRITGNLSLGNDAHLHKVNVGGSIFIGAKSMTFELTAGENIIIGEHSASIGTCISADGDIVLGCWSHILGHLIAFGDITLDNYTSTFDIITNQNITIGNSSDVLNVIAGGNIIIGDNCSAVRVCANGDITFGSEPLISCNVYAKGNITFGTSVKVLGSVTAGKSIKNHPVKFVII